MNENKGTMYHISRYHPSLVMTLKGAKGTISLVQAKDAVLGPNCMLKSLWG